MASSTDVLPLLAAGQAVSLATATAQTDPYIEALINTVLPTNNAGAIAAEQQRQLMMYVFSSALRQSSLAQTWTGNEATKALTPAAGLTLFNQLTANYQNAITAAVNSLLGGVGPAYNTLKLLNDLEITEQGQITQLTTQVAALQTGLVRADGTVPVVAPLPVADAATASQAASLGQVARGICYSTQASNPVITANVGPTLLGTTRSDLASGTVFTFTSLYGKLLTTTGTLVSAATISIGTNAPAYDNLVKGLSLAALTTPGENIPLSYHNLDIPAGTPMYVKVATAQAGGSSTFSFFGFGQYR